MEDTQQYPSADFDFVPISRNMMTKIENYVEACRDLLRSGIETHGRTQNFSLAVRKGRVVEIGWNNYRRVVNYISSLNNLKYYDPKEHRDSRYMPSLHSEMSVLKKLGSNVDIGDFRDYDVVNVRLTRGRDMDCVLSAPCCNCRQAMRLLQVGKVYFHDGSEWKCIRGR